jgi:hypothetical protein
MRSTATTTRLVLATWLVVAALPLAAQAPSAPVLRDINRIGDLQTAFERDAGKVRIVLLLSPT